jgi:hypothetical protein
LGIAACGPSAGELRRDADQRDFDAEDGAAKAFARGRSLAEIDRPQLVREDAITFAAPIARGRGDGTTELVAIPADGGAPAALAVAEAMCPARMFTSCGCRAPFEYRYYRDAAGAIVVVKLVPDVYERVVHSASCVVGCGHQVRPEPRRLRVLGAIDPAQVEVVDLHYAYEIVHEICDTKIKAP